MSTEQRRLHRHDINGLIDVVDSDSGECLGKLANVHSEGLLLLSEKQLEIGKSYRFRLATNGEVELPWMEMEVVCVWVGKGDGGEHFQVGCVINSAPEEALAVLQQLDL